MPSPFTCSCRPGTGRGRRRCRRPARARRRRGTACARRREASGRTGRRPAPGEVQGTTWSKGPRSRAEERLAGERPGLHRRARPGRAGSRWPAPASGRRLAAAGAGALGVEADRGHLVSARLDGLAIHLHLDAWPGRVVRGCPRARRRCAGPRASRARRPPAENDRSIRFRPLARSARRGGSADRAVSGSGQVQACADSAWRRSAVTGELADEHRGEVAVDARTTCAPAGGAGSGAAARRRATRSATGHSAGLPGHQDRPVLADGLQRAGDGSPPARWSAKAGGAGARPAGTGQRGSEPGRRSSRPSSFLQDRQVVVGDLQDDAGHGGAVVGADASRAQEPSWRVAGG